MPTSHQSSIATKDLSRAGYWRNNGKDISRMPHLAIYQYTHERPLAVSIIQRLLQWKKSHFIQSENGSIHMQFSISNLRLSLWIVAVRLPIQQPNSCDLLPTFPLLHILALHFWPYRIFHSRIFSRPVGTLKTRDWKTQDRQSMESLTRLKRSNNVKRKSKATAQKHR